MRPDGHDIRKGTSSKSGVPSAEFRQGASRRFDLGSTGTRPEEHARHPLHRSTAAAAGHARARGAVRPGGAHRRVARRSRRRSARASAAGEPTNDVVGAIEHAVPARLARAAAPSLRAGHQRHRRDPPHQSRTRAARAGRARARRGAGRRLHQSRIRPRRPARAAAATCMPNACSAGSPAPTPPSSSTTTRRRRC